MELIKGEVGQVDGFRIYQNRLVKSMLAAMVASMVSGLGMVHGGKHVLTERVLRRKTNTHPMITAPDGEIRLWNDTVTTRQVLRARIKPWKSLAAKRMWESRP